MASQFSRLFPLGEIHLRQTSTVAVDPGIVVCRPQTREPLGVQTAARVEPVHSKKYTVHSTQSGRHQLVMSDIAYTQAGLHSLLPVTNEITAYSIATSRSCSLKYAFTVWHVEEFLKHKLFCV